MKLSMLATNSTGRNLPGFAVTIGPMIYQAIIAITLGRRLEWLLPGLELSSLEVLQWSQ